MGVLKVAELVVLADDVLLVLLFALLLGLGRTLALVVGVLLQPATAHDKNTKGTKNDVSKERIQRRGRRR